jgi:hypothetical protein
MRLGWRVPLPGPFSVYGSAGGRRRGRARGGSGCLPWLGVAVLVGLADEHPWLWIVAGVLAVAGIALVIARRR